MIKFQKKNLNFIKNALIYDNGFPVDCYVHNQYVMPTSDDGLSVAVTYQNRFKRKLYAKSKENLVNLISLYPQRKNFHDTVTVKMEVGAEHDGYFKTEDIVFQAKEAIEAFDKKYGPETMAVFILDDATNHKTLPSNALYPHWLHLGDKTNAKFPYAQSRDGWHYDPKTGKKKDK